MILPFEELPKREFALCDIKVIRQEPSFRVLEHKSRPCNGFIYVLKGNCRYLFEGGEFTLSEGSVAYLPLGSCHRLEIMEEGISFYRVDFTLFVDRELAFFSDRPIKLCDNAPPECAEAIGELEGSYLVGESSIKRTEKLCAVLSSLQRSAGGADSKRLMPAVRYLQENAASGVSCAKLAELCFLGSSRFYDLFQKEFGMSPLEYRDRLLLRRASDLLSAGDVSVKEVAFAVGFDNAAYFSRFFKKHSGVSPSKLLVKK